MPPHTVRQGDIYIAELAPSHQALAVVVSCEEANAIRKAVTVCPLEEHPGGEFQEAPTLIVLPSGRTGLSKDLLALASPYTIPPGCLISPEGRVPADLYRRLEQGLKRVLGWEPWPT